MFNEKSSEAIFTTLHFLHNLRIGISVTIHQARKPYLGQHSNLFGPLISFEGMKCCEYDYWEHIHNTSFLHGFIAYA
jgi:hypothetical protein